MAPHSCSLSWKIPWTEESGRLQSMGSRRIGHDWATSLSCIGEGNGNPLYCSAWRIPGTGEPGGLLSMGSHRVRHDWSDLAAVAARLNEVIRVESSLVWFVFNGKRHQGCKPRGEIIINPGERTQNKPCNTLILGFQSSELWGNECLLFKAPECAILLC